MGWRLTVIAILFLSVINVYGQDSLRGVKTIAVGITIAEELEILGVSQRTIKTEMELKLRMAGIKVIDYDKATTKIDNSLLHFYENGLERYDGGIVFNTKLVLIEVVKHIRLNDTKIYAGTWQSLGSIWSTPSKEYYKIMMQTINDQVNQFINQYLKDNPK
jgi:hypothetical protein